MLSQEPLDEALDEALYDDGYGHCGDTYYSPMGSGYDYWDYYCFRHEEERIPKNLDELLDLVDPKDKDKLSRLILIYDYDIIMCYSGYCHGAQPVMKLFHSEKWDDIEDNRFFDFKYYLKLRDLREITDKEKVDSREHLLVLENIDPDFTKVSVKCYNFDICDYF